MMHDGESTSFRFNRCGVCGSVFLTNPGVEADLGRFYTEAYLPYRGETAWGKYAGWVRRDDQRLNAKRVRWVRPFLAGKGKQAVLDIGCGKPDFLARLRSEEAVEGWASIGRRRNGSNRSTGTSNSWKGTGGS